MPTGNRAPPSCCCQVRGPTRCPPEVAEWGRGQGPVVGAGTGKEHRAPVAGDAEGNANWKACHLGLGCSRVSKTGTEGVADKTSGTGAERLSTQWQVGVRPQVNGRGSEMAAYFLVQIKDSSQKHSPTEHFWELAS